jgi:hypothetical protein
MNPIGFGGLRPGLASIMISMQGQVQACRDFFPVI